MPRAKGQVVFPPTSLMIYKDTAANQWWKQENFKGHCYRRELGSSGSLFLGI